MGTGPFAVPSFEAVRGADHEILAVVTKPEPEVKSRKGPPPSPVRTWAEGHGLNVLDPPSINDPAAIEQLQLLQADLFVVCDYGQILKSETLAASRLGGINLHGSLLPAYRGAAPVQRALLSGDRETGVSVIHMTPRLDGGPILATRRTEILETETAGELEQRLSRLGVQPVLDAIEQLQAWDGSTVLGDRQDSAAATKAARLNKREAEIDWSRSNRAVDCHVRGMQPWPVAFGQLPIKPNKPPLRLAILQVTPAAEDAGDLVPGQITGGTQLVVVTGEGSLRVERLRPAGKREMTGEEFMRGHQLPRGTRFLQPAPP